MWKALCGGCVATAVWSGLAIFPRVVGIITPSCATFPHVHKRAEVSAHPKKCLQRERKPGTGVEGPFSALWQRWSLVGMDEASS